MIKNIYCNNCGKSGHSFNQCKYPITSIGIIIFNHDDKNNIKYLMIRRKDSLGYVDFMRGKYPIDNSNYLLNIIDEMTLYEKKNLINKNFDYLWNNLWGTNSINIQYKNEEFISNNKFSFLKNSNDLYSLINSSKTNWKYPEWGVPKGRRNYQEKDLTCALREFEEETGYSKYKIKLIHNILPFEEIFIGSNYKSYKHKYYIGYMSLDVLPIKNFEKTEVSKVEWFNYNDCIKNIRPYNYEKIQIINNINHILKNYDFF